MSAKRNFTEAATEGALYEKLFWEISQNQQESTCARASFLIKLQAVFLWIYEVSIFKEHPRPTASEFTHKLAHKLLNYLKT